MPRVKMENFENDDETTSEIDSFYNTFIACYWILMIVAIHFLLRYLNTPDIIEPHVNVRLFNPAGVNIARQFRPGNNFHRRFIENLEDEDLGYGEDLEEEFDSRGI